MYTFVTSLILVTVSMASAQSLKCKEGFTANVFSVPFNHWVIRNCSEGSDCFVQELKTKMFEDDTEVDFKFGGCISSSYSSIITCDNLFGADSTLDPAVLLRMVPDLDKKFEDYLTDLVYDRSQSLKTLFSNGKNSKEFIDGLISFLRHLEFHTDKLQELSEPITKCWESLFAYNYNSSITYREFIELKQKVANDLLLALGKLDTKNQKITNEIYSFLGTFEVDMVTPVKNSSYRSLVENLPGLVKYTLPDYLKADAWFDVIFELFFGDLDVQNPKQSSENVIKTFKTVFQIPTQYKKYLDPALNTIPTLFQQMIDGNYTYAATWSLELFKSQSQVNPTTTKLETAVKQLLLKFFPGPNLPDDINTLITWIPGVAYNLFPGNKKDIDRVYNELATGLQSIDLTNLTKTLAKTKMSDFLVSLSDDFIEPVTDPNFKSLKDLLIINFSKTFYNVMGSEYASVLDKVFIALAKDFKDFPNFDIGKVTENLIVNMGWTVPIEIKPILNSAQMIYLSAMNGTHEAMKSTIEHVFNAYQDFYPGSKIPGLLSKWFDLFSLIYEGSTQMSQALNYAYFGCSNDDTYANWNECFTKAIDSYQKIRDVFLHKFALAQTSVTVDTVFEILNFINFDDSFITAALQKAFPQHKVIINLMRTLDVDDVKDLTYEWTNWFLDARFSNPSLSSFDSMVGAINITFAKMTSKLGSATKELRILASPDICKYASCSEDSCNTDQLLNEAKVFAKPVVTSRTPSVKTITSPRNPHETKMRNTGKDKTRVLPEEPKRNPKMQKLNSVTDKPQTTTSLPSGSKSLTATAMLNIVTLWLACQALFL